MTENSQKGNNSSQLNYTKGDGNSNVPVYFTDLYVGKDLWECVVLSYRNPEWNKIPVSIFLARVWKHVTLKDKINKLEQ